MLSIWYRKLSWVGFEPKTYCLQYVLTELSGRWWDDLAWSWSTVSSDLEARKESYVQLKLASLNTSHSRLTIIWY